MIIGDGVGRCLFVIKKILEGFKRFVLEVFYGFVIFDVGLSYLLLRTIINKYVVFSCIWLRDV